MATVNDVAEGTLTTWNVALMFDADGESAGTLNNPVVTPAMAMVSPALRPCAVEVLTVQFGFPVPMLLMLTRGVKPVAAGETTLFNSNLAERFSCCPGTSTIGFR